MNMGKEKDTIVVMQATRYAKVKAKTVEGAKMQAQKLYDGFEVLAIYERKHGTAGFNLP
jgi:hypothetical protein